MDKKKRVKKYDRYIGLRLSESEYEKLKGWSESAGMSVSEFMRSAVRNDRINLTYTMQAVFPDVTNAVKDMGKSMSDVGSSLNRIARWLNGGNSVDKQIREAVTRMMTDIGAIRRKMNRLEDFVNNEFMEFGKLNEFENTDDSGNGRPI